MHPALRSLPLLLFMLLLSLPGVVLAQDDGEGGAETSEDEEAERRRREAEIAAAREGLEEDEEMIVFGELEAQRRRQQLDQDLRDLGYRAGKRKDGRTVYRPEVAWHPSVIIDDDGYAIIKRSPVRFEPWVQGRSNLRWISCIPPFTIMCIKLSGQLVSDAKLTPKKQVVAEGIDPALDSWRAVVVANAMAERLGVAIPDMLEATWQDGGSGEVRLETPTERRAAILEFWVSRACTPEGAAAREVAADFLRYEVQPSAHPVTPAELAAVNARSPCGDVLRLE